MLFAQRQLLIPGVNILRFSSALCDPPEPNTMPRWGSSVELANSVEGNHPPGVYASDANNDIYSQPTPMDTAELAMEQDTHSQYDGRPTPDDYADTAASATETNTTTTAAPLSSDIRLWSVENVRDWLLEENFPREAEAFFQQEIDGACLLLMRRMDVLTELGIKLGPAVKIYERIKRLQSQCSSPPSMMD